MIPLTHLQNHYQGIRKSFEKALPTYDAYSIVQQKTGFLLIQEIGGIKTPFLKVLDLGCGTGIVTHSLCQSLHPSLIHLNDFSRLSLERAGQLLEAFSPKNLMFNFDHEWPNSGLYNLIFSNMAFQWSLDLYTLFKKCHRHLETQGIFAFSLPLEGTFQEIESSRILSFYAFDPIFHLLSQTGFQIIKSNLMSFPQNFESYLQALRSIKNTGASYVPQKSCSQTLKKSKLFFPTRLTYQIGFFIARKDS